MNWQDMLDNAVGMQRAARMKTSEQLTLGELILKLEHVAGKEKPVIFDKHYHPVDIDSWRGSYDELALEYTEDGEKLEVKALLQKLKAAVGATFYGYKGGEFLMGKTTPVWVAHYGESHGFKQNGDIETLAVVGVSEDEHYVIIETKPLEF